MLFLSYCVKPQNKLQVIHSPRVLLSMGWGWGIVRNIAGKGQGERSVTTPGPNQTAPPGCCACGSNDKSRTMQQGPLSPARQLGHPVLHGCGCFCSSRDEDGEPGAGEVPLLADRAAAEPGSTGLCPGKAAGALTPTRLLSPSSLPSGPGELCAAGVNGCKCWHRLSLVGGC